MELIYDTLIDYDDQNNLIPMVAEKWTMADDGLSYVFTIRDNAAFSDGSEITAEDVVFSVERAAESEALKSALSDVSKVEATGDKEVTITLSTPSRVFLNALASVGNAAILSKAAVDASSDYFTKPTATSGPWSLAEIVAKGHATLVANTHYWDEGKPTITKIQYDFATDSTAMAAAVETGTIDMTYNMVPADAVRLKEQGSIQYYEAPSAGLISWGMDKTKPPFADERVRQALAYVVPRKEAMDTCWSGIGPVSYGDLIFEGQSFYIEGEQRFNLDRDAAMEKAAELLDEAGWVEGPDGVRVASGVEGVDDGTKFAVDVPYENSWAQARCNTEMLQQFAKPVGIQITPLAHDKATFWSDVAADKFTLYHGGNNYATVDDYFGQTFMCDGGANNLIAKWCDKEADALIAKARASSDLAEVADLYRQVQDMLLDQQPMITIGAQYAVIGTSPKLNDYYPRADASNRALVGASLGS